MGSGFNAVGSPAAATTISSRAQQQQQQQQPQLSRNASDASSRSSCNFLLASNPFFFPGDGNGGGNGGGNGSNGNGTSNGGGVGSEVNGAGGAFGGVLGAGIAPDLGLGSGYNAVGSPAAATTISSRAQQQQQQQQPQLSRNASDASSRSSHNFLLASNPFFFPGDGDGGGNGGNGGNGNGTSNGGGVGSEVNGAGGAFGGVLGAGIAPDLGMGSGYSAVGSLAAAAAVSPRPLSPFTAAFDGGTPVVSGARLADSVGGVVEPVYMPRHEAGNPLQSRAQGLGDWTPPEHISRAFCGDLSSLVGMPPLDDFVAMTPQPGVGGDGGGSGFDVPSAAAGPDRDFEFF